jgi:hypothetical protein
MRLSLLLCLVLLAPGCASSEPAPQSPELRAGGELAAQVGKTVRLRGTAADAKGGALVVLEGASVYVGELASWDAALVGKPVVVAGTLARRDVIPAATTDASGAVSQGDSGGEEWVVDHPAWTAAN